MSNGERGGGGGTSNFHETICFFLEFLIWIWKLWIIKQEQPGVATPKCLFLFFHKGVLIIQRNFKCSAVIMQKHYMCKLVAGSNLFAWYIILFLFPGINEHYKIPVKSPDDHCYCYKEDKLFENKYAF